MNACLRASLSVQMGYVYLFYKCERHFNKNIKVNELLKRNEENETEMYFLME